MLYPLKFKPLFVEKIWGGNKIEKVLGRHIAPLKSCGESWEISAISGHETEVLNGFLAENTLSELVEIYMGDLVGDKIYNYYGNEFPLLIKYIDAQADLSIQVHPDDDLAQKRNLACGKTEMWYIVDAAPDSKLYLGFKAGTTKVDYLKALENGNLENLLNTVQVSKGEVYYIPAGLVHAIGKGVLLAEIQQSSDVTYRVYDYNRCDADGNYRPLHIDEALEAINFDLSVEDSAKTYSLEMNKTQTIVQSPYFQTNILNFNRPLEKVYAGIDSFIIYICLEGDFILQYDNEDIEIKAGDVFMLPALLTEVVMIPRLTVKILEIYIPDTDVA